MRLLLAKLKALQGPQALPFVAWRAVINCAVAPQKRSAGVNPVVLVPAQLALETGGFYFGAGSWKSGLGWH